MKKYWFIFKAELMSNLQYIKNIIYDTIGYLMHVTIFYFLWDYVYDDPSQLINGYSKTQMVWYIIFTEVLWKVFGSRLLCRKICSDVKGGNIAYHLNKPYSYVNYALSSHFGERIMDLFIFSGIGFLVGHLFLNSFPMHSVLDVIVLIVSSILAVTINTLFVVSIGLVSFFIEDSNPLLWVYTKLLLVLGVVFPIEFFPTIVQKIVMFSPIFAVCYGPARIFVNNSLSTSIQVLLMQICYVFLAYSLCMTLYQKGVKKINVNGG